MTADNGQLKDSQNLSSTQQIYTDPSSGKKLCIILYYTIFTIKISFDFLYYE